MAYYYATSSATTTIVWSHWCFDTSSTSITTDRVWGTWVNTQTTGGVAGNVVVTGYRAPVETGAQRQDREAREAEQRARYEAEAEERRIADAKAEQLLKENLSDEQRQEYEQRRHFHLITAEGRRYRIEWGRSRNVRQLDEQGNVVCNYCIHPSVNVPNGDTLLAQKLMLETNEREFLRVANAS